MHRVIVSLYFNVLWDHPGAQSAVVNYVCELLIISGMPDLIITSLIPIVLAPTATNLCIYVRGFKYP